MAFNLNHSEIIYWRYSGFIGPINKQEIEQFRDTENGEVVENMLPVTRKLQQAKKYINLYRTTLQNGFYGKFNEIELNMVSWPGTVQLLNDCNGDTELMEFLLRGWFKL